jgi:hypothetical protein
MVGAFRWPTRPLMPIEVGLPSVKAREAEFGEEPFWAAAYSRCLSAIDGQSSKE